MSDTIPQTKYDVFVSFRGKDVREGFLSHLIEAFHRKQIYGFVDEKLERGNEISQSLVEAIEGSAISLIIFSEDYASSHWCLEELEKILKCREERSQTVIPIFYRIDPAHVRHQRGSYANAFAKHEDKYHPTKVKTWRQALNESANLSGVKSSDFRTDAELLEEVINLVLVRLERGHSVKPKGLIGIDKPIAHVESLLTKESKDVRSIGIWGMGGIGKTTIAEEIFNKLKSEYDGCCFLRNVREESRRWGINSLKEKLVSSLLKEHVKIEVPTGWPDYIERRIKRMKVLIILDDVNDSKQLEELFGSPHLFGLGSRIIVTTRNKQVLIANRVNEIYPVGVLSSNEALQLFCLNAFSQSHIEMEYYELSKMMINYAQGIPLVLKVLGHHLCGKDKEVWQSLLEKLKRFQDKEVYDVMRLSYDDLDRQQKEIFLDLACFFSQVNMEVDFVKSLLEEEFGNSVVDGLERLKDKALISITKDNKISMHDIVQEMAWEIVHQESIRDPGSCSRLWDAKDICDVLENDKGTDAIRSITISSIIKTLNLSPEAFAKMTNLRFFFFNSWLDMKFIKFPDGLQSLPCGLRYLRWEHCPLNFLPDFYAENLVILDLSYAKMEKLWVGVKNLVNLKKVYLRQCLLLELPDFSKAINLQVLDICGCTRLTSVHPSIFSLNKLEKLCLTTCTSVISFSCETHSCSLRVLELVHCERMTEFLFKPEIVTHNNNALPSFKLEILDLTKNRLKRLPLSIKNLTSLRHLILDVCWCLESLPELPPSLEVLKASVCSSLKTVSFPSAAKQLAENRKQVEFWHCTELDKHSYVAVGLNARINVTRFAYQHISAAEQEYLKSYDDYYDNYSSYQAMYVYPGESVPNWFVYKATNEDSIVIDLFSASLSPPMGFILCFVVGNIFWGMPSQSTKLQFNIILSDSENAGKEDDVEIYTAMPPCAVQRNHVCVVYDQRLSCYLNSRAKLQPKFKIKATRGKFRKRVTGFGVCPMNTSAYHNLIQQMNFPSHDEK